MSHNIAYVVATLMILAIPWLYQAIYGEMNVKIEISIGLYMVIYGALMIWSYHK